MSVDVCYVLSFGFAARTVLHTELVPALRRRNLSVAAICPGAGEAGLRSIAERLGIKLHAAPTVGNWFAREYLEARRYLFEDVRENPALWARHLWNVEKETPRRQRLKCRALLALNWALVRAQPVRQALAATEASVLRSREVRELLRQLSPRLLVCTYPINALEAICLAEARRLGIQTVVQLLSWDNITCKGRFPVLPHHWLSWGPIMTQELREYYGVNGDQVHETGVAHFDAHVTRRDPELLRSLLTAMGLDSSCPYLLFGMSSPYFAPHEIEIVENLASRVRSGEFGPEVNLVVRPHPQNVRGNLADATWLPRLRSLAGPRVGIAWPALQDSKMEWALEEEDLPALVNWLGGCAVNINSGSTFAIDGLCHGKPVVLTLFDANQSIPWHRSARRAGNFFHLRKLIATEAVAVAESFKKLSDEIQRFLEAPQKGQATRCQALLAECGSVDGQSCARIAAALVSILDRSGSGKRVQTARPFR